MIDLSDRSALVTGARAGSGAPLPSRSQRRAARVIVTDLDKPTAEPDYDTAEPSDLDQTVSRITESGGEAVAAYADVRGVDAQRDAVALGG